MALYTEFCSHLCGDWICEIAREAYFRRQAAKGNPWQILDPVQQEPLTQPLFEAEALDRAIKRRERAFLARSRKPHRIIRGEAIVPRVTLGFKFVTPRDEKKRLQAAGAAHQRRGAPSTARLFIAGTYCPPIRGNWMSYMKRSSEPVRVWKKRVRSTVAAMKLGKELRANERFEDLPIWEHFKRCVYLGLLEDVNPFEVLRGKTDFDVGGTPLPHFNWRKNRPLRAPKCKNLEGSAWADRCLLRKQRLDRLRADLNECRARQRQRRAAVVLCDKFTHKVQALSWALEKVVRNYVQEHPELYSDSEIEGQMDGEKQAAHGDTTGPISDKKANVVLEDKAASSVSKALPKTKARDEYACLAATSMKPSPETMADRWITLWSGNWVSGLGVGKELFNLDLPKYILTDKKFKTSPVYSLFRSHTLWRGNMRLKFQLNANQRQYGQLQVRFYYMANTDKNFSDRNNIYCGSQMPHVLLSATDSNVGDMLIPFEFMNPFLTITRGEQSWDSPPTLDYFAYLGSLVGLVIVPLTVAQTTIQSCSLTIKLAFEDSEFTGLVDSSLVEYNMAEGQMFPLASIMAINEMKNLLDNNRDQPTFSSAGMPMIPVNAGSWCFGTGLPEFSNVLRLNPKATTPYETGRVPPIDEMSIDYVKDMYGLFKILHWTPQHQAGQLLLKMDAAPLFEISKYPSVHKSDVTTNLYVLPPVAVLSSMFAWWRGELELRIDVVGAKELTGRLIVSYVPKYYSNISLDVASNCTNAVFDFQNANRQISFKIPFFSERMFWERSRRLKDSFSTVPPPGMVHIMVQNPLIPNSTIPSDCYLVCYIRGGKDFEVSVPACPLIGTSFFPSVLHSVSAPGRVTAKQGYYPVYTGYWHSISTAVPVLRYGAVSDHVAQFTISGTEKEIKEVLYKPVILTEKTKYTYSKAKFALTMVDATPRDFVVVCDCNYCLPIKDPSGYIYLIALPFTDDILAAFMPYFNGDAYKSLIQGVVNDQYEIALSNVPNLLFDINKVFEATDVMIAYFNNAVARAHLVPEDSSHLSQMRFEKGRHFSFYYAEALTIPSSGWWAPATVPIFEAVVAPTGNAGDDERSQTAVVSTVSMDTACGKRNVSMKVFGERFLDLKDLCRRYQLFASGKMSTTVLDVQKRTVILKFPAVPHGLDLDVGTSKKIDEYWNRSREGTIPLVASGYRFFTGSLRYRLCLDNVGVTSNPVCKIFVQHRPDIYMDDLKVETRTAGQISNDDIELPGYATYYQYDVVNNVICFEIPFYLPVIRSLLQRPIENDDYRRWSHLGQVAVGITFESRSGASAFEYELYYSLGDDARFSVFVGFPPMLDATNIPPTPITGFTDSNFINLNPRVHNRAPNYHPLVVAAVAAPVEEVKKEFYSYYKDESTEKAVGTNRDNGLNVYSADEIPEGAYRVKEIKIVFNTGQGMMDYLPSLPFSSSAKAIDNIGKIDPEKVNSALDSIGETTSYLQSFKDTIKQIIPSVEGIKSKAEKYLSLVINVITNLIHCLLNLNLKSIGVAIVSILSQIKVISLTAISPLTDALANLFAKISESEQIGSVIDGEMACGDEEEVDSVSYRNDSSCTAAYISTLIAGVAASLAIGCKVIGTTWKSFAWILFDGIKAFAMTANCLFTFVKNNLLAVQRIGNWLVDKSPRMKDIAFLKDKDEALYKWSVETMNLTLAQNERKLLLDIKMASRVYELDMIGNLLFIQSMYFKFSKAELDVLNNLRKKLEKTKNRLVQLHMAPPVRFEPFVYELTGATGTAKSTLLNEIPYRLLKHLNLEFDGDVIFHRALGNAYWNNCSTQPVCSIDEKFPIEKPGFDDVQIAELFQLKSRCVFNPPMADIPDKNLRYNPLIVQYASNNAFPRLSGLLDDAALYRRRDCLICVQFRKTIVDKYAREEHSVSRLTFDKLNYEEKRNFSALEFFFAEDVTTAETKYLGPYSFHGMMEELKRRWQAYYMRESTLFKKYLDQSLSLAPENRDVHSDAFNDMWKEQINLNCCQDPLLLRFNQAYEQLLEAQRAVDADKANRQPSVLRLLSRATGKEPEGNDAELLGKLNLARESWAKVVLDPILSTNPIKGDMASDETEQLELNPVAFDMKWGIVAADLLERKQKGKLCIHYLYRHCQNFDYYTQTQFIKNIETGGESLLLNCQGSRNFLDCMDKLNVSANPTVDLSEIQLLISDFAKIGKADGEFDQQEQVRFALDDFEISLQPCENKDCLLNDPNEDKALLLAIVNHDRAMKELYNRLEFEHLEKFCPSRFLNYVKEKIKVTSEPKTQEEMDAKVGFLKGAYTRLRESLYSVEWRKWFGRLAMIIGIFAFFLGIFKLWRHWGTPQLDLSNERAMASIGLGAADIAMSGQLHASGDVRAGSTSKTPRAVAVKTLVALSPKGEMGANFYNISKLLKRNTFILAISNESGKLVAGRCLGICGRTALVVDHYWESWQNFSKLHNSEMMHLTFCTTEKPTAISIKLSELKYQKFRDSSLGLVTLPPRISAFKDIRNKICPVKSHGYSNGLGTVYEATSVEKGGDHLVDWMAYRMPFDLHNAIHAKGHDLFSDFSTGDTYCYSGFSGAGRCGSVLVADDLDSPIIGMHVAGQKGLTERGFAEALTREMFAHLNNSVQPSQDDKDMTIHGDSMWHLDAEVIPIGKLAAKFAHRANEKTKIIPSLVQNSEDSPFPVVTSPGVLSPKDVRLKDSFSPMLEGCKHHGKPLLPFDRSHLKIAIDDYENLILAKCKPSRLAPRMLTRMEAVCGFEGVEGYEHLEWNTSEGFPWSSFRPKGAHDKRWLFDFDSAGKCTGINGALEKRMDYDQEVRLNNLIPQTVFVDCLKDCRVSNEKVLEPGKTRIFSISPVHFTIQQRQCTLDFVNSFMYNRLDLEHAIGINPDSLEWGDLGRRLLATGSSIADGDFSKFGDTIPVEIIQACYHIILNWYRKYSKLTMIHEQSLKIMAYEVSNCKHLMFDFLYQTVCGQPSGNSLTVIINSMANSIYQRLAWLSIMDKTSHCDLASFRKLVSFFSYGDDIILSLNDKIKEQFNAQHLCIFFGQYNLKFTNASKGASIIPYRNLSQAEFLKRSFSAHPTRKLNYLLAPLGDDSVIETVNWVNRDSFGLSNPQCANFKLMSIQVCEDALRNSFGKGPVFYTKFKLQLEKFWRDHQYAFIAPTWEQLDKKVFDHNEILMYWKP